MEYWKDELYHHGIKGQKWGVRRFQNADGSLTSKGKKHYQKDVDTLNKYGHKLTESYKKLPRYTVSGYGPSTGNYIQITNEKTRKIENKFKSLWNKTYNSLQNSDYTIGHEFINNFPTVVLKKRDSN